MRARGAIDVTTLKWKQGKIVEVRLVSGVEQTRVVKVDKGRLHSGTGEKEVVFQPGVEVVLSGEW